MTSKIHKRRLIIDIEYDVSDCNDDEIHQLDRNLDLIVSKAAGDGLFTNHTAALTEIYNYRIVDENGVVIG